MKRLGGLTLGKHMADGHAADATTERTDTDRRDSHQYFSTRPDTPDIRRTIPVTIAGQRRNVTVSSGVFSSSRLDPGTAVLLEHAPAPPATWTLLDLGCGWGPITLALGLHSPQARIWSVDVNERALELTAMNARSNNVAHVHAVTPDAVPAEPIHTALLARMVRCQLEECSCRTVALCLKPVRTG